MGELERRPTKRKEVMTKEIDSDDKVFKMFKQYMKVISNDNFGNYKEPETVALALTLAHQIGHVICVLKPDGYEEPSTVRKINS